MSVKSILLAILIFSSWTYSAIGQFSNLKFENYSTLEGLSSSTCTEIFEDSDGYLWFGTIDGLNKYDGYRFTVYRPVRNESNSLSSNRITSITEDHLGYLWIGTTNGLNILNRVTQKISRYQFDETESGTSVNVSVNQLLFDETTQHLWVATNQGLRLLDLTNGHDQIKTQFFEANGERENALDNTNVVGLIKVEGALWVVTDGRNVHKIGDDLKGLTRYEIKDHSKYVLNHIPLRISEAGNSNFIIGNNASKLLLWNNSNNTFKKLDLKVEGQIPVFAIYQDKRGYIWVATDGFGLFILNTEGSLIDRISHSNSDRYSLPNNQPSKVLEDSNGLYWIATYNEGVCKLDMQRSAFVHLFHQPGNRNSLSAPIAQSVIQSSDGKIWIGTDGGGLNRYDEKTGLYKHFNHSSSDKKSISSDKIVYLTEGNDGSIWVCTWDGGLSKFNPDSETAKSFKYDARDPNSIRQNTIWCAVEDSQNRLWLGTQTAGLNLYDKGKKKFYAFTRAHGLASELVFSLFIDSKNRLLLGTGSGLQAVDLNQVDLSIEANELPLLNTGKALIPGIRINHIAEAEDGSLWVGSDIGLHHLSSNLDLLKSYYTVDGLPNNLIVGVAVDNDGFVWVTSKSGLSRLNVLNEQFKNFNINDGIQGLEFQSKSIFKTRDGRILVGGINGLNIFRPEEVQVEYVQVKPIITQFRIFNTQVGVGDTINGRIPLSEPIQSGNKVRLFYDEGFVSFDFVVLYFSNPEGVHYAHRMKGANEDWVFVEGNRTASYANLTPGNYQFEVKAILDGDWENAPVSSVKIEVLPPPWKTWWAYLAYFIVLVLILWGSFKFYLSRIDEERERELDQMKLRFFMNVSHEFRTPLTLILNPVDKIISSYQDQEVVKNAAYTIQRSARKLLNLVNQLLDFRKLDLGKAPLDPIKGDIVQYSKDVYRFYEELAKSKSINIRFRSELDSYFMWFDPDKLEKILGNLLSNAIKFTRSDGDVEVFIALSTKLPIKDTLKRNREKNEYIVIAVKDTGIGLKKDQLSMVFERFFHVDSTQTGTGIGLNFTKSLVEQHDGEITVESEYQKGTTFKVILPVNSRSIDQAIKSNKQVRTSLKEFDSDMIKSLEYDLAIMDTETAEEPAQNGVTQTVLIVEDNKELRNHLKNELRSYYKIKEAADGKEGLEKAKSLYPDIIISDVMMPEMDGFEMCGNLKTDSETSHIPIILLTARTLEEDRFEGYSIGADAYLPKPFNVNVLKARINNLLESRRKMRERFMKKTNILPSSEITTNSLDEQFLDKATEAILSNISDSDFGLEQLLEIVGASRSHFYRKIQSLTGQNPSNFIRSVRLKYAAELLKQNQHSIKEVAFKVGFNSTAYFSKTFKELFNMTPNEFIQEHLD